MSAAFVVTPTLPHKIKRIFQDTPLLLVVIEVCGSQTLISVFVLRLRSQTSYYPNVRNASHFCAQLFFMAGDDLEDGLAYDYDLGVEDGVEVQDETEQTLAVPLSPADSPNPKKRKASLKLQEKKKLKMAMDIDHKKNLSRESAPEAIADYINDFIRKRNPDLSALELAELYFKKTDFRSTADFADARTLANLALFVAARFGNMLPSSTPGKKNTKKLKKSKKDKKNQNNTSESDQPTAERKFIAVLSMSALRACDVHRALREIPGSSLKLINKNKLNVDLKLVASTWSRVLCCTPGRLTKVLGDEALALKAEEIKIILMDNTYLDQKMQNIWDIKETLEALRLLTQAGAKVYLY